jgi:NADH-quinone oxidoreductase subunit J
MFIKFIFNFLCFLLLLSAFLVISLNNSIQAILNLILCFITSSLILLLLNCELFAFLFLIIYVGAIAVLFVFVLMMIELKDLENKQNIFYTLSYTAIPLIYFIHFLQETITQIPNIYLYKSMKIYNDFNDFYIEDQITELEVLGQLLYTKYTLQFLIIGLLLTLAVLSIGILTIDHKRQQNYTKKDDILVSRVL